MFISLHNQLRRHRRAAATTLVVATLALAALTAHAAVMSGGMDDHAMGNAATICLVVGGSLAAVGVSFFAVRRLAQRPLWLIPAALVREHPFIPTSTGFLVRAGPPPLLQVFRR